MFKLKKDIKRVSAKILKVLKDDEGGGHYTEMLIGILVAVIIGGIVITLMVGVVQGVLFPGIIQKINELFGTNFGGGVAPTP